MQKQKNKGTNPEKGNSSSSIELENKPKLNAWPEENTAILVTHGIGEELPIETMDLFGRGLVKELKNQFGDKITLTHRIVTKPSDSDKNVWFDNVLRINKENKNSYIDLYEYYWSNYTADKATTDDIEKWLAGVAKGASSFYGLAENAEIGKAYKDKSPFFDSNGKLNTFKYRTFLYAVIGIIPVVQLLAKYFFRFINFISFGFIDSLVADIVKSYEQTFDKYIGDIVVYNVTDPKSKFYSIKRKILDGAVNALQYLVELENQNQIVYPNIIVAGHSLGSQVSFDAINKINLMVNKGEIANYTSDGKHKHSTNKTIADRFKGFVTFGSPLDKIAFFLREIVPNELYIRQQILDHYHCFKQRDWSLTKKKPTDFTEIASTINRFLDDVKWINFYDNHDPISGHLDYYNDVKNVDCKFKTEMGKLSFTHSDYWSDDKFYKIIINNFLD